MLLHEVDELLDLRHEVPLEPAYEIRDRRKQYRSYLFAHIAECVLRLLDLACVRLGELLVHVADVLRDDLGDHGSLFLFSTELQDLLLRFRE